MAKKPRVLVVDDEPVVRDMLVKLLAPDYEVKTCETGAEAVELLRWRSVDAVLSDIRMPDMDGMEVLRIIKADWPDTEVILMTAFASIPQAVAAVKAGAYDYVHKPFEPDEPTLTLAKAVERKQLREQARMLREQVEEKYGLPNIIGYSEPMQRVYELARKAAESDATVLLSGESGTGKELFARAIHQASARRDHRFVAINCAAVPRELIESELFGHVRGAFTGASKSKQGLFMAADEGTLFLDEIVELVPELQVKTTRAIQEKEIRRVGDTTDMPVDVRIIAATNQDLEAARKEGRLREDLYYRLSVFPIHLPPLRERAEDVPGLVRHFLRQFAGARAEEYEIDPAALALLMDCSWPGNVRELRNAIERAVVVSGHRTRCKPAFRGGPRYGRAVLPGGNGPPGLARPEALPAGGPDNVQGQRAAGGTARGYDTRELLPPDAEVRPRPRGDKEAVRQGIAPRLQNQGRKG